VHMESQRVLGEASPLAIKQRLEPIGSSTQV
jgi:hypothetical protein